MDLLGHINAEYSVPGGYHHDLDQLPNGNFLIASDDFSGSTVEDAVSYTHLDVYKRQG